MPDQVPGAQMLTPLAELIERIAPYPVESSSIHAGTVLSDDLGLDSIALVALMALAEEAFGVELSAHAERVVEVRTVGDALALIDELRPQRDVVPVLGG